MLKPRLSQFTRILLYLTPNAARNTEEKTIEKTEMKFTKNNIGE